MQDLARQFAIRFYHQMRPWVWTVIGASVLLNVLVFGAALYLLLVYDVVLPSNSVETLFGLFLMLVLVYLFQGVFDFARNRAMRLIAEHVHRSLTPRLHYATANHSLTKGKPLGDGLQTSRDLDQVYGYLSGPGPTALIDLPWVIIFLVVLTILHFWLGVAALVGVLVMAAIAWLSNMKTQAELQELGSIISERNLRLQAQLRYAETAQAMGMHSRLIARSQFFDNRFLDKQGKLTAIINRFGGIGRIFRMFVQSLILTVGALLVIAGEASAGIIIAASVLSGRALAPVDLAISTWRSLGAARKGWERVVNAIAETAPPERRAVALELPSKELSLQDVWVVPPGAKEPVVQNVSFRLEAGQSLALIGPSGAGKTSLAKAILGIWTAPRGEVRIDGAMMQQWDRDELGRSLGYVPQIVELIEGTISENISRFEVADDSGKIVAAAEAAGMHSSIIAMENGYETVVGPGGAELSAGQRQRIGLARALYGNPFLLVLDEPSSNLDHAGDTALSNAINAHCRKGGIVVLITHRPATLSSVSHVAVMNAGKLVDFGARDEVLQRSLKNSVEIPTQEKVG